VTLTEAARLLAVSKSTVYRLIRQGELEAMRVGNRPRVTHRSIGAYVGRNARILGE